jgi:protoporphyrinogen oxidase
LSAALSLVRRGWAVTVLERDPEVGGLARTVRVGPQESFDLGGHRFFTGDARLLSQVRALLGEEWTEVERRSRIYLQGRFFDYPLRPGQAFFSFGPKMSIQILVEYLWGHLRTFGEHHEEETFEEWALARFGETLYRIFFQPYTEKVWGIRARELSADWSRERIDLLHLIHALIRAGFPSWGAQPRTYASRFLYPRLGIGRLADRLTEEIRRAGGEIQCGIQIRGMERAGNQLRSLWGRDQAGRKRQWGASQVVSTIPIHGWVSLLSPPAPPPVQEAVSRLNYRHMIFVYLLLSGKQVTDDTWIYLPDAGLRVSRIHEPKNWSQAMAPEGRTSLCAELFSSGEDALWSQADDSIAQLVAEELNGVGLLDPSRVLGSKIVRVSHTHPVYRVGFQGPLREIRRFLAQELTNLHLLGRTGAFQYKNMDQVVADGFELGERLAAHLPLG